MTVLAVILARAGSKGLPGKCLRDLNGRAVIAYTFDHARESRLISDVVFSTDCEEAKQLARSVGIAVVDRPAELASDTATVDAAARHAVESWEARRRGGTKARGDERQPLDAIVLLYGNIPVRKAELIDAAIEKLIQTGASSVRSVAPVTKQHPDWIHRLDDDRMVQFRKNSIYRRQDLEPFYYHDGAIVVVTREALFGALETPDDKQSFLGRDRRAIVCEPEDAVDIDGIVDLHFAESVLRRSEPGAAATGRVDAADQTTDRPITNYQLPPCKLEIAGRGIGPGHPAFVIAEAGVNHDGSVERALAMVDAAEQAGADAVKFQMFRAEELASATARTATYQQSHGGSSQHAMLSKLELTDAEFVRIAERCAQVEILLVVTPFGTDDVRRLVSLRTSNFELRTLADHDPPIAAIKIASTDLNNTPLLDAAVASGRPLFLSTGASTEAEIRAAVEFLRGRGAGERLILLHCVSSYPTPIASMNLGRIRALWSALGVPVGLSDHSTETTTGAWAVAAGACVLEKHFTLDRSLPGPDHAMSLTPDGLAEYIHQVRGAEAALGDGRIGLQDCEREVREVARKSVVAAVAIPAGTRIADTMLTLKRPGTGIPPGELPALIGREAKVAIPADALLSWAMLR